MATFLPPVVAELTARTTEFSAEMLKARGEMTATTSHGSSSFGKLAAVGKAAFFALGTAAVGIGVEAIHMADEFEGAHARLETAVKNSGSSMEVWGKAIKQTDDQMAKLGFNSTDTESALATLTGVTHDTGKATELMGLAADIARGRHIDLGTAVAILTKVESGHVSVLGKLGIATKDATGKAISQEEAVKRLSALYGGNASAYAQTFAGKMQTLNATVHNLGTELGLWLIPKVEAVASALASTIHWFNENRAAADALAVLIGGPLVIAMGAFVALKIQDALGGIAKAWDFVTAGAARFGHTAQDVGNATSATSNAMSQLSTDANTAATAAGAVTSAMGATRTASLGAAAAAGEVGTAMSAVTTETLAAAVSEQMAAVAAGELSAAEAAVAVGAAADAAAATVSSSAYLAEAIAETNAAVAAGTLTAAEGGAAIANAAATSSALAAAAANTAEATAEAANAAAATANAAAQTVEAAAGGANVFSSIGRGLGSIASGLAFIAPAAIPAAVAIGGIAYGLHQNDVNAQKAKAAIADYLANVQRGMQSAADPVKYLDDQLVKLREKMDLLARAGSQTHGIDKAAIGFVWDQENKKYKAVLSERKALDEKATADHTKAIAEQTAAQLKAIAKEKASIAGHLAWLGASYGKFNEEVLKSAGLSSEALKTIEKNIASALSTTDAAIFGYTDVVQKFGAETKVTSTDIVKFLQEQVTAARQWSQDMKRLARAGIDQGMLEELYKAGPKSEGLVKGLLDTVRKGGIDTINTLVAQARGIEISANKTLSSIMIQGETSWNNANAWFAAHPLTPRIIVSLSGAGAAIFNPNTGTYSGPGAVRHYASGGDVAAGQVAQVGEHGPELVQFGRGGHVFPHGQGPSMSGGYGSTVNHYAINISPGLVTDPRGLGSLVVDAIKSHERANGPLPFRVKT